MEICWAFDLDHRDILVSRVRIKSISVRVV